MPEDRLQSDPIHVAYTTVKLLVERGFHAGVIIGPDDVAIGIYVGRHLMQVKIHQDLADKGPIWIADSLEESILKVN